MLFPHKLKTKTMGTIHTKKNKWAFFTYAHNLGDFTRALETAKGIRNAGHELCFFNHGGTHIGMIEEQGFQSIKLEPLISDKQDGIVMAINQFRAPIGTPLPFSVEELKKMVEADISALQTYKPDGVYCGLNISSMISVPYLRLPRVTMVPTTLCPAFYKLGLATFPNTMETNWLIRNLIPQALKRRFFNSIMLKDVLKKTVENFNIVRKHYGLAPIYNSTEFVNSDLILLPDLAELSGLPENELPEKYKYTGPIFAQMNLPVPEKAKQVFSGKGRKIFISLGSSGSAETLIKMVDTAKKNPANRIVCSTTTILDPQALGKASDTFFATRFLPAHRVNEMADIAITHGGQGTIQTAVWSGTPVVGVGFQSEQQANIDGISRAGMATRLNLNRLSQKTISKAIEMVSAHDYKQNALNLQKIVRNTDGVGKSVELMNSLID